MSNQVKDMTWREVQERLREFQRNSMGIIFLLEQMFIWRKHWLKRQQKKRERLCIQVFILGILGVGVTESEL